MGYTPLPPPPQWNSDKQRQKLNDFFQQHPEITSYRGVPVNSQQLKDLQQSYELNQKRLKEEYNQESHNINIWLAWNQSLPESERWDVKPSLEPSSNLELNHGYNDGIWSKAVYDNVMPRLSPDQIDIDALWEKMYTKVKAVIVQCRYCGSHNAISNPTCVQCGAPMGGTL